VTTFPTLTISEGENILALLVFLAVAGIVSGFMSLAHGARRRALEHGPRPRRSFGSTAPRSWTACGESSRYGARIEKEV
jgi:hypothetical protein